MSQPPPPLQPQALNYAQPIRNDIREIAVKQRAIMYCILAYIICFVCQLAVPGPLKIVFGLAAFGVSVTATVFVFMLALRIYSTGMGIFLGILTLIPLIGLFVLLTVNGKATKILKENGIKVGLMGAAADQIPQAGPPQR